jgi:hypothetical protein
MEPTRFISWQDHYASANMLAADPALLLEAIEEQADRAYDRIVQTPCTLPHHEFRRRYIDAVYAQL